MNEFVTPRTTVEARIPGSARVISIRAGALDANGDDDSGPQDVSGGLPSFGEVTATIEDVSQSLVAAFDKVKPDKATVSFGVEVAVKAGKLVSLLTEAGGTATLTVTLEWSSADAAGDAGTA